MKTKLIGFCTALLLTASNCISQDLPLGHWSDYLSYQQGITVCQGGGKFYCCCASGVFSFNPSDNSLQRFNKVTGLSDIGCSVARYNTYDNTLVIGYSNGNIDLFANNQVVNIPDLKNSSVQGSKTINNVYFDKNYAYISCGQGLMVIDLSQDIIIGLYYIGPSASVLNIYATTIYNDTIYAATAKGMYYASKNDPNLSDFQDWTVVPDTILPKGVYNGVVTSGNKMYACFAKHLTNNAYDSDTIYVHSPGKWSLCVDSHNDTVGTKDNFYSLESTTSNGAPFVTYCGNFNASVLNASNDMVLRVIGYGFSNNTAQKDAILDNSMNLWIADGNYGLVETANNNTGQSFYPPGPFSNSIFDMKASGSTFYIAPGGYDGSFTPLYKRSIGISAYNDGTWTRLLDDAQPDTINDLNCIAIDPNNPSHMAAGSWGQGLIEYNNNAIINVFNPTNSSLQDLYPYYGRIVRIGGTAFDTSGNLWASNSSVYSDYLSVRRHTDGKWQALNFGGIAPSATVASKILITQSGAKWVIFSGTGILAYQDNGTFEQPNLNNSVFITDAAHHGGLPSKSISCLTQDQNGAIWVGTSAQVVVFYSPDNVFDNAGDWDAQNVYVQQTGYTQYLMQNQYTTSIAVDGANRKWIGTLGGGAFLMSADGTQQILNFTAENSPLLSDNIQTITIDQVSGEVFFGTDQGLVSYRGTATEGGTSFGKVYAYPDPVPHGYTGAIAIKNLVTNSDIKIATVSGELVYHTVAQGGQAIWYGTNFNGDRVKTGVYLVFCTSPDGTQNLVTKLLLEN